MLGGVFNFYFIYFYIVWFFKNNYLYLQLKSLLKKMMGKANLKPPTGISILLNRLYLRTDTVSIWFNSVSLAPDIGIHNMYLINTFRIHESLQEQLSGILLETINTNHHWRPPLRAKNCTFSIVEPLLLSSLQLSLQYQHELSMLLREA